MNRIVRAIDAAMRRRLGIWEIPGDPECIFRLARGHAEHALILPDGTHLSPGDPVAVMHLWGERVPAIPPHGADLAWARRTQHLLVHSMHTLARQVRDDPRLADALALGNTTSLPYTPATVRMFEHLGFTVFEEPERTGLAVLLARGSQVWTRLLRRAYNAASDRSAVAEYTTRPLWISRATLLARYTEPKGAGG